MKNTAFELSEIVKDREGKYPYGIVTHLSNPERDIYVIQWAGEATPSTYRFNELESLEGLQRPKPPIDDSDLSFCIDTRRLRAMREGRRD